MRGIGYFLGTVLSVLAIVAASLFTPSGESTQADETPVEGVTMVYLGKLPGDFYPPEATYLSYGGKECIIIYREPASSSPVIDC